MNYRLKPIIGAAFAALLLAGPGCASTPRHESTGEYVDDSVITLRVKAAFVKDSTLSAAEINVETFKGQVQLSGFVHDAADVVKASEVARNVDGVKSIVNSLVVKG